MKLPATRAAPALWRRRPDRFTLLMAAIAALGVALTLAWEVTYGAALHEDSIIYISTARNLLAGGGFYSFDGEAHTIWPPFYPLLLSAVSLGVFDPGKVAGPLNAVILGLTIFVVGQYLRQRLQSRLLALWAGLAMALAVPVVELASWTLSGALFILLATLALIQTDKFLAGGKTSALIGAVVFCALAWQTRYIGVAVPVVVGLWLLFQPGATLRQRAGRGAGLALIAGLPMALWLLRNYWVAGALTGNYRPVDYSLPALLKDVIEVMAGWVVSWGLPTAAWPSWGFPVPEGLGFALPALAVAILLLLGCIFTGEQRQARPRADGRSCWIFAGFVPVYLILLIGATMLGNTWHGIAGVAGRYLTPLYIPLLVTIALALDCLLSWERERKLLGSVGSLPVFRTIIRWEGAKTQSLLAAILLLALAIWLAGQVAPHADRIIRANSGGWHRGYAGQPWADSATLRYIQENPLYGLIYSNILALAYLHNDGTGAYRYLYDVCPPVWRHIDEEGGAGSATGAEQLAAWLAGAPEGAYLVWFNILGDNSDAYCFGVPALRAAPGLEPVAELDDGLILKVNRDYAPAANPYQLAYEAIAAGKAGEPAARAAYAVYRSGTTLTYFREPCADGDTKATFFLHLIPAEAANLPGHRKQYGFDNRDFAFPKYGLIFAGKCLALVTLPDYAIASIRTGQYTSDGQLWEETLSGTRQGQPGRMR